MLSVRGKVTDQTRIGLPEASILIKGTTLGPLTCQEGNYQINVPDVEKAVLVVGFIGFEQTEVAVNGRSTVDVQLAQSAIGLDERVVIVLGITRKSKSLGYAVQSIDVNSMTEIRDANHINMLAGTAAGVNMISAGGSTASTREEFRGNNSLTGNNQPLYVVEGMII